MARTSRAAPSSGAEPPVRVVLVLEATAAAAATGAAARREFIDPLLDWVAASTASGPPIELALVAYRARPPHAPAAVVRR